MQEQNGPASRPEDGIGETPSDVLIWAFVGAYIATCHLKPQVRAMAFLEEAAAILDRLESTAMLHPIRASAGRRAVVANVERAAQLFEMHRPELLARLPPR